MYIQSDVNKRRNEREESKMKNFKVTINTVNLEKYEYTVQASCHEQAAGVALRKLDHAIGRTPQWRNIKVSPISED